MQFGVVLFCPYHMYSLYEAFCKLRCGLQAQKMLIFDGLTFCAKVEVGLENHFTT
jgi:hypothetical protein